jgi:hypothetical protein
VNEDPHKKQDDDDEEEEAGAGMAVAPQRQKRIEPYPWEPGYEPQPGSGTPQGSPELEVETDPPGLPRFPGLPPLLGLDAGLDASPDLEAGA